MIFGTDLAIERREITNSGKNDGVTVKKRRVKSASVTEIEITTDAGAEKLGKPVGTYVTVELPPFSSEFDDADSRMLAVRDEIKKLLPKNTSGVLVVGLGNSDITPDALGPKTAKDIFSTRHITKSLAEEVGLPSLRPVSSASPGVLGQTGIESAEMIRGIMNETSPDAVITVDALSARSIKKARLYGSDDKYRYSSGFGSRQSSRRDKPKDPRSAGNSDRSADGGRCRRTCL